MTEQDPLTKLETLLAAVPPGRLRIAAALVSESTGRTYAEVAELAQVHVGTVHAHLKRLRERHPEVYAALMEQRRRQLAARHEAAVKRDQAHSHEWHRKQRNRRFYQEHGRWPWEHRNRR